MASAVVTQRGSNRNAAAIDSRSLHFGNRPRSARRPASARAAKNSWGELVKSSWEHAQQCAEIDVMELAQKGATQKPDIYTWRLAAARRAEEKAWHVSHRRGFGEGHKEKNCRRKPPPGRMQFQQEVNDEEEAHCRRALQIPVAIAARARQERQVSHARESCMPGLIQEPNENPYSDQGCCEAANWTPATEEAVFYFSEAFLRLRQEAQPHEPEE